MRPTWRSARAEARSAAFAVGTLVLCVSLTGCGLLRDGPGYDAIDLVDLTYTDDEQREIGFKFDRSLRDQIPFIDDVRVIDFVEALGQSIVDRIPSPAYVYRFRVIEAPSLNAFAVFGGYIYLHTGTLLTAGSVDELAGVLGHEIAHVELDHHSRIQEKTQIPDLLARAAGLVGAGATGRPEVFAGAVGINVALQLHYTRKLEAEADHRGSQYMAAAGYDPSGIARFFERLLERKAELLELPPYLYSHPDVEDRIGYVEVQAARLARGTAADAELAARLPEVRAHLAQVIDQGRTQLFERPPVAAHRVDPFLRDFERARTADQPERALEILSRAERVEANDPRIHFGRGELLASLSRHAEAARSFRRTIALDPARALPYFRLAQSLEALGTRDAAVRDYEKAEFRAGANGQLRRRAQWAVRRLTFDEWAHCRGPSRSNTPPCPGA